MKSGKDDTFFPYRLCRVFVIRNDFVTTAKNCILSAECVVFMQIPLLIYCYFFISYFVRFKIVR
jgi:hypothetical protein